MHNENWLIEMIATPAAPSPALAILACGHAGRPGEALCFVCAQHEAHALGAALAQGVQAIKASQPASLPAALRAAGYEVVDFSTAGDQVGLAKGPWPEVVGVYPVGGRGQAESYLVSPHQGGDVFRDTDGTLWVVVSSTFRGGSPDRVSRYTFCAASLRR